MKQAVKRPRCFFTFESPPVPKVADVTMTALILVTLIILQILEVTLSSTYLEESHQIFADSLIRNLYSQDNECSSALGVNLVFSLVYPGSTGNTTTELQSVFGYNSSESKFQLVWNDTVSRVDNAYQGRCKQDIMKTETECVAEEPTLKMAFSAWFDDDRQLATEYKQVVRSYAHQIDFEAANSPIILNKWVKNKTNNLIDYIVLEDKPLYPPYVLIAVNSIYLKASWSNQFLESKTNLDSFYTSADRMTEKSKANFMHGVFQDIMFSETALLGHQVLKLPFAHSSLSMVFISPTETNADSEMVSSRHLLGILAKGILEPTYMAIALPKFKFESTYEDALKSALQKIGVIESFSGGFCDLFGSCGPYIDTVIQKTVIDVNEKGVEAAAVTAIFMRETSFLNGPSLVILDHPFQFLIYDESENVVLFEGRLGAPEVYPNMMDEPLLLTDVHSSSDFWSKNFGVHPKNIPTSQPTLSPSKLEANSRSPHPTIPASYSTSVFPSVNPSFDLPQGQAIADDPPSLAIRKFSSNFVLRLFLSAVFSCW